MIAKKGKKMTPRTPCKQHDTIVEKLKAITDRYEGHEEWLSELKVKVEDMHTKLTENLVRADYRDQRLEEIMTKVDRIDVRIENGLKTELHRTSAKVDAIESKVNNIEDCIEKRRKEHKYRDEHGLRGALSRGFFWIIEKSVPIALFLILYLMLRMGFLLDAERAAGLFGVK